VLICEPNAELRREVIAALPEEFYEVLSFREESRARTTLDELEIEVVIAGSRLKGCSGIEWLTEVRQADPETNLILMLGPDEPLDTAVDAINVAGVAKVISTPIDPDIVRFEIDQAIVMFGDEIHRRRKLALSSVKVRRLTRSYEKVCRDLASNRRQLRAVHHRTPRPPATTPTASLALGSTLVGTTTPNDPLADANLPVFFSFGMIELLAESMEGNHSGEDVRRARRLTERCARALAWSEEEIREVTLAAAVHHALLYQFPQETHMIHGKASHASTLADRLADVPGMESISMMIRHHHHRWDGRESLSNVPRGTWLLQILSIYEQLFSDPALARLEQRDPLVRLTRATDRCLQMAGTILHPDLAERVLKEFIPSFEKRRESCLSLEELEEGMVLSRGYYVENMVLVGTGTTITANHLTRIEEAAGNTGQRCCWVEGAPRRAKSARRRTVDEAPAAEASRSGVYLTPVELPG
jgi:response regulator RpfG family c-di-GMP phosphodiesterase